MFQKRRRPGPMEWGWVRGRDTLSPQTKIDNQDAKRKEERGERARAHARVVASKTLFPITEPSASARHHFLPSLL